MEDENRPSSSSRSGRRDRKHKNTERSSRKITTIYDASKQSRGRVTSDTPSSEEVSVILTVSAETTSSVPTDFMISEAMEDVSILFDGSSVRNAHSESEQLIGPQLPSNCLTYSVGKGVRPASLAKAIGVTNFETKTLEADLDAIPEMKKSSAMDHHKQSRDHTLFMDCGLGEFRAEGYVQSSKNAMLEQRIKNLEEDLVNANAENIKNTAKIEELQKKLSTAESTSGKQILSLTLALQEKATKLETYEKIHQKMERYLFPGTGKEITLEERLSGLGYPAGGIHLPGNPTIDPSQDLLQKLTREREEIEKKREGAELHSRELEGRCQSLIIQMNELRLSGEGKLNDAQSELKIKGFHLDRLNVLFDELQAQYKNSTDENLKLKDKIETLKEDVLQLRAGFAQEVTRLTIELQNTSSKLEVYNKIEKSLDDYIDQVGSLSDCDRPKDIFEDFGSSMPTDPRRRIKHSLELATKVCDLERKVSEQRKEIRHVYDDRENLRSEIESLRDLSQQPVSQLIEKIADKNRAIAQLRSRVAELEKDYLQAQSVKTDLERKLKNMNLCQESVRKAHRTKAYLQLSKSLPAHGQEETGADLKPAFPARFESTELKESLEESCTSMIAAAGSDPDLGTDSAHTFHCSLMFTEKPSGQQIDRRRRHSWEWDIGSGSDNDELSRITEENTDDVMGVHGGAQGSSSLPPLSSNENRRGPIVTSRVISARETVSITHPNVLPCGGMQKPKALHLSKVRPSASLDNF